MESLNLENVSVELFSDGDLVLEGLNAGVCIKPKGIPLLRDWLLKHFPQPHDGWIKCADRLPENDGYYLITSLIETPLTAKGYNERTVGHGFYAVSKRVWIGTGIGHVLAWQEKIKPYAGDP